MRTLNLNDIILPMGLLDLVGRSMAGNLMSFFVCYATVEIMKRALNSYLFGIGAEKIIYVK